MSGSRISWHLPVGSMPADVPEDWDFVHPRALPAGWINNGFVGWGGHARIAWPERGLGLQVEATGTPNYLLTWSGRSADDSRFEPVSHPVDAHNLAGGPEANGLAILAPGESTALNCHFAPEVLTRAVGLGNTISSHRLDLATAAKIGPVRLRPMVNAPGCVRLSSWRCRSGRRRDPPCPRWCGPG